MKTKLLAVLLLIAVLLTLTSCGKTPSQEGPTDPPAGDPVPSGNEGGDPEPEPPADETLFAINGYEFHMDRDAVFKDLHYTVSGDFRDADHGNYIQYNYYQDDDSNLFFFRIFYYKGGSAESAAADLGLESGIPLTDGSNGSLAYRFYEKPRDDGGTMHFYFIEHEGDMYVANFVCKYDIKDFEQKAVASLSF